MDDIRVPNVVKQRILADKIRLWRNTLYDAQLDARVAEVLDNEAAVAQAEKRMKDTLKAIDLLEDILKEEGVDGTRADGN